MTKESLIAMGLTEEQARAALSSQTGSLYERIPYFGRISGNTSQNNDGYTKYTSYILGEGSIVLDDIGDSTPYEMNRNPAKNGGEDTLYVRDRCICGVDGISFEKPASITASATNENLSTGANWHIINDETKAIPHKAIAIAKIVSRG